jgi:hypothetical protein
MAARTDRQPCSQAARKPTNQPTGQPAWWQVFPNIPLEWLGAQKDLMLCASTFQYFTFSPAR